MKAILVILIAVIIGAALFVYFSDNGFIVSKKSTSQDKVNLLANGIELPNKGKAPELTGIESWINSEPFTLESLRGKVVLVDFWTYTCINCIRTFPHLSGWHEKYKDNGFVLLGVHSPEFDFEKKKENVLAAIKKHNLKYPVALDNDHATWNAYNNRYWPAHYLIDVDGNIRYTHFGEGKYAETESAIQQLLLEAKLLTLDKITKVEKAPAGVDFQKIGTPEIYLGYLRINNLGNKETSAPLNKPYVFREPESVAENRFYFVGKWNIMPEFAEFVGEKGKLIIRYKANKANVVLVGNERQEIQLEVKLDGKYLDNSNKGKDIILKDGKSYVLVRSSGLYNFSDTKDNYDWHTLEIIIPSSGLRAFTFTFG